MCERVTPEFVDWQVTCGVVKCGVLPPLLRRSDLYGRIGREIPSVVAVEAGHALARSLDLLAFSARGLESEARLVDAVLFFVSYILNPNFLFSFVAPDGEHLVWNSHRAWPQPHPLPPSPTQCVRAQPTRREYLAKTRDHFKWPHAFMPRFPATERNFKNVYARRSR